MEWALQAIRGPGCLRLLHQEKLSKVTNEGSRASYPGPVPMFSEASPALEKDSKVSSTGHFPIRPEPWLEMSQPASLSLRASPCGPSSPPSPRPPGWWDSAVRIHWHRRRRPLLISTTDFSILTDCLALQAQGPSGWRDILLFTASLGTAQRQEKPYPFLPLCACCIKLDFI